MNMHLSPEIRSLEAALTAAIHLQKEQIAAGYSIGLGKIILAYLIDLNERLRSNQLCFDYLHNFPIGNLIIHTLNSESDKEMVMLLRRIDDGFLELTGCVEYEKFKRDFSTIK